MNVTCPECSSVFRVDPAKVPAAGVRARCSVCSGIIPVPGAGSESAARTGETPASRAMPLPESAEGAGAGSPATTALARRPINPFLNKDPNLRAKRLARALVSDIITYQPAKHAEGLRDGTIRDLFKDEIKKSYEEYTAQVGQQLAESTPYFQEALNEVLGGGRKIF